MTEILTGFSTIPIIISWSEAKELGLKYYFNGQPCKYDHVDVRWVSNHTCKTCQKLKSREQGRKNIAKIVSRQKERAYGINAQDFEQMKQLQNYKCYICENDFKSSRDTHVDHCHKTGLVRKLLCSRCNTALGLFKDNVIVLEKAILYLKAHDDKT